MKTTKVKCKCGIPAAIKRESTSSLSSNFVCGYVLDQEHSQCDFELIVCYICTVNVYPVVYLFENYSSGKVFYSLCSDSITAYLEHCKHSTVNDIRYERCVDEIDMMQNDQQEKLDDLIKLLTIVNHVAIQQSSQNIPWKQKLILYFDQAFEHLFPSGWYSFINEQSSVSQKHTLKALLII